MIFLLETDVFLCSNGGFEAVVIQSLSCSHLFVTLWTAACQASLSFTISCSLLNSRSLSWWCHPVISSSVAPFSACPQSCPASGSFPVNWLLTSGDQSIRASASASVLPMNIQCWYPSGLTGWITLQSKRPSRVFSSTTIRKHQFFGTQLYYGPVLTFVHDYWKHHRKTGKSKEFDSLHKNIL